jgi:DNA repair protein RadC
MGTSEKPDRKKTEYGTLRHLLISSEKQMGISLVDFIIIGDNNFYLFNQEELL